MPERSKFASSVAKRYSNRIKHEMNSFSSIQRKPERRRKVRIYESFPARVEGTDAEGNSFEIETVVDDLSAGGARLQMPRLVVEGQKLSLSLTVPAASEGEFKGLRVAAYGVVRRVDSLPSGLLSLAIEFTRFRIL
jgi:hypothetical protein